MAFPVAFRAHLAAMKPYVPGKPIEELERELGITNASKLASNENPLGPSPKVLEAIQKALPKIGRYPDGGAHHLSGALAKHLGVDPKQILLGHGSNELLVLLGQMVLSPGDEVLFSQGSFLLYPLVAQLFEAKPVEAPAKEFTHDMGAFLKALTPKTRLVFLCNPNNPTGTMIPLAQVEDFLKACPPQVLVVLDEAYYEYVEDPAYFGSIALLSKYPNLVVLRTFSKAYGLAGLRVGYGVARPELVEIYQKTRQPFNVNSMAMTAAEAALGDPDHMKKAVELNGRMRKVLSDGLRELGLRPLPTQSNFVYFEIEGAPDLYQALLQKGMIVRPMGPGALRVTTGTEAETRSFLKAFREVLAWGKK
ncbi:MAG TPA: histidinol-phosphate transaminase [bacterium]|nr:histidinol-phosphate transaminase [bacterium]